jgi:hypothetical protein
MHTQSNITDIPSHVDDAALNSIEVTEVRHFSNQTLVILDPQFVDVYEFGDYIYYFFTDLSQEQIADASRVS